MRGPFLALLLACDVTSTQTPATGVGDGGVCRAVTVVSSDYLSTDIGALSAEGTVLSKSVISSGSAAVGLGAALSGDVVLPHDRTSALVLLDRTQGALTWVDPKNAQVKGQLRVAPGFPSNPHDYLELSERKAYVTRYGANPKPGAEAYDQGNDVLIIDPATRSITGRLDLKRYNGSALARPDRMTRAGELALVVLGRLSNSFHEGDVGLLVGIDIKQDAPIFDVALGSAKNCVSLATSPNGKRLAIGCSGVFPDSQALTPRAARDAQVRDSALVVLDLTQSPPSVIATYPVAAKNDAPLSLGLAFADNDSVLATSYGDLALNIPDQLVRVDVNTGESTVVMRAGRAFVYGDVLCDAQCRGACFLADAESGRVLGLGAVRKDATQDAMRKFDVGLNSMLPPRMLGGLTQ
jgi:hypothetical protein